jgi:hypothetical protein
LGIVQCDELAGVLRSGEKSSEAVSLTAAVAALTQIARRDPVEAMLATQMLAVHSVAMRLLLALSEGAFRIEAASFELSTAGKLLRVYIAQIEALHAYRGRAVRSLVWAANGSLITINAVQPHPFTDASGRAWQVYDFKVAPDRKRAVPLQAAIPKRAFNAINMERLRAHLAAIGSARTRFEYNEKDAGIGKVRLTCRR